jgi:hypothetical protein
MRVAPSPVAGRTTASSTQSAVVVGVLLVLGAAACHGSPPRTEVATEVCTGTEVLLVRNETGGRVDVFMSNSGGGTNQTLLGTVNAGPTEFSLPPRVPGPRSFMGRSASGAYVPATYNGQVGRERLSFRVVCRQGG